MEKSFTAQLGARRAGAMVGALPAAPQNCSAVTRTRRGAGGWGRLRGAGGTQGLGDPDRRRGRARTPCDSSLEWSPSCRPCVPRPPSGARPALLPRSPDRRPGAPPSHPLPLSAHLPRDRPAPGTGGLWAPNQPALPLSVLFLSPWTPATISCSSNHRPLHRLCPRPGAPSPPLALQFAGV